VKIDFLVDPATNHSNKTKAIAKHLYVPIIVCYAQPVMIIPSVEHAALDIK